MAKVDSRFNKGELILVSGPSRGERVVGLNLCWRMIHV